MAPGIRGLVMLVFTLPSYPYVFKIIKDVFGSSKEMDQATVKQKFMMVKQVDRVGRMADTLEFSNVLFPLDRFDDEVMEELRTLAPSSFEIDGDQLIIKHLYIERRMEPLNIHLERMERSEQHRKASSTPSRNTAAPSANWRRPTSFPATCCGRTSASRATAASSSTTTTKSST